MCSTRVDRLYGIVNSLAPALERMKRRAALLLIAAILLLFPLGLAGQETVTIHVSADAKLGAWQPIWRYFGYDEPNYTYMKYGPASFLNRPYIR